MADGEIIIDASINTESFKKELAELIKSTEQDVKRLRSDLNRAKLDAGLVFQPFTMQRAPENIKGIARELENMQRLLSSLRNKYDSLTPKIDVGPVKELSSTIRTIPTRNLELISERMREINRSTKEVNNTFMQMPNINNSFQKSVNEVTNAFSRLSDRIFRIVRNAILFNVLSRSLRTLTIEIGFLINRDSQLSRSLALLKANLINAFTPIVRIVLPWIRAFVSGLVWLSQQLVRFINSLTGSNIEIAKTSEQAKKINDNFYALTHNVKSSSDGLGKTSKNAKNLGNSLPKANKELNKLLASFDKLEVIDFGDKGFADNFKSEEFKDSLNDMKAAIQDTPFNSIAGKEVEMPKIGFEVDPGSQEAVNKFAGWSKNIISWLKKNKWAVDLLIASFAGLFAFFKVKKFAKILGLSFGNPTLLIIGAIIAAIALLILNWDKVLKFMDQKREWLGGQSILDILKDIWKFILIVKDGIVELIKTLVNGSVKIYKAIEKTFVFATDSVKKIWTSFADISKFLGNDIKKGFNDLYNNIKGIGKNFSEVWNNSRNSAKNFAEESIKRINSVKDKANEISKGFINSWRQARDITVNWLNNIWKEISSWFRTLWVEGKKWINDGMGRWWDVISNWFKDLWKGLADWFKKAFGNILNAMENIKRGSIPRIDEGDFNGKIPRLAQGAVLRGGDPFLAYLNDQPRGQTNIEAPLNTIVDAFRQAVGTNNSNQNIVITATGDMAQFIRMLNLKIVDEQSRVGTSMITTTIGGQFQ